MPYNLEFDNLHIYDPSKTGISVPVTLKLSQTEIEVEAKLDTGASFSIFARALGEDLGLDIEKGQSTQIATVTGSFIAYGHNITLSVFDFSFDSMVYFAASDSFSRNVLGRQGFLNHFRLAVIDYEGKLFLSPYE